MAQQPPLLLPALEVGTDFATNLKPTITSILRPLGYTQAQDLQAGLLFSDQNRAQQIIARSGLLGYQVSLPEHTDSLLERVSSWF